MADHRVVEEQAAVGSIGAMNGRSFSIVQRHNFFMTVGPIQDVYEPIQLDNFFRDIDTDFMR